MLTSNRFFLAAQQMLRAGAAVLLLGVPAGAAGAQPPAPPALPKPPAPAAPAAPASPSAQSLRDAIAAKYEVLPVHDGVVLKPRTEEVGVRTVEVSGDTISVNGERVSEGVLRAWLNEQAEPILRLHRLPAAERQALFGLKRGGSPGATGEQEIPDTGAAAASTSQATPKPAASADTAKSAESATGADTTEETESADTTEAAPEAPTASSGSSGSRVRILGGITIAKDEVVEQAVAVLGSVRVEGQVAQDAVAVGGSAVIDGKVGGSVVAVGGSVHLGPHAEVMGDVSSVGGTVDREEGSKVHGSTEEAGIPGSRDWHRDIDVDTGLGFWPLFRSMDLIWKLISLVVLSLLVFLCLLVARRPVDRAEYHVVHEPWKAILVGFAAQFLFLPILVVVTILLAITIIGCALFLLYPFLLVGVAIAFLLGFTAVAHQLGRLFEERFHRRFGSPYAVALMGVVAIEIWTILGHMVGLGGGFLRLIALIIVAFGFAVKYAAWTMGIGAMILARLNRTPAGWQGSSVPVPAPAAPPPAVPEPAGTPGAHPDSLPLSEHWNEEERRWEEPPPPER
jgi:cytoskeletal protein CcmA (bactofilin family)